MANNVIGLFDSVSVADQVVEELANSGFDRGSINRFEGDTSDLQGELRREGIPDDEASYYADGLRQGGALVSVRADDARTDDAVEIMNRYADVGSADETRYATDTDTSYRTETTLADTDVDTGVDTGRSERVAADTDEARLAIAEEQLRIGKREVERGGVRVRSYVRETPVEEQVRLRDETVHVDRRPVDRAVTDADTNVFEEKTYEFSETDEEAIVDKETRVKEEVVISKDVEERTETVRDTIRETDVEVEEGGVSTTRRDRVTDVDEDLNER